MTDIPTSEEIITRWDNVGLISHSPADQARMKKRLTNWKKDIEARQRERCAEAYKQMAQETEHGYMVAYRAAILSAQPEEE